MKKKMNSLCFSLFLIIYFVYTVDGEFTLKRGYYGSSDNISAFSDATIKSNYERDITIGINKPTVLLMAQISNDTYYLTENNNIFTNWTTLFKKEIIIPENSGLRGLVFASSNNETVIIAFKGTSPIFLGYSDGPTAEEDKKMDNIMFSCCCAHISERWYPICDCYNHTTGQCNSVCLSNYIITEPSYYHIALNIYYHVRAEFSSSAKIWLTGHSLGGSIASLVALTVGAPAILFEAPGELLYARRIGIPIPADMSDLPIYHFGNLEDPIFLGQCTGVLSSCYIAGYAMESRCHVGNVCSYPAQDYYYNKNINNHKITTVINKYIIPNPLPSCTTQDNCVDCM